MNDPNWDRNIALLQVDGDGVLLDELLVLFNQAAADDFRNLESGLAAKDYAVLIASAHSIKGAAASLGMERISALAEKIESKARQASSEGLKEQILLLGSLLAAVQQL